MQWRSWGHVPNRSIGRLLGQGLIASERENGNWTQRAETSLNLILVGFPSQMLCFSPTQETCRSCFIKTLTNKEDIISHHLKRKEPLKNPNGNRRTITVKTTVPIFVCIVLYCDIKDISFCWSSLFVVSDGVAVSRLTMHLPLSKEEQKTGDATLPQTEGQKAEWGSRFLFCFVFFCISVCLLSQFYSLYVKLIFAATIARWCKMCCLRTILSCNNCKGRCTIFVLCFVSRGCVVFLPETFQESLEAAVFPVRQLRSFAIQPWQRVSYKQFRWSRKNAASFVKKWMKTVYEKAQQQG